MTREREYIPSEVLFEGVTVEVPSTFERLTFGQTGRYFRESLGLTQQQVAEEADVNLSTVKRAENDKVVPKSYILNLFIYGLHLPKDGPEEAIVRSQYARARAAAEQARATRTPPTRLRNLPGA